MATETEKLEQDKINEGLQSSSNAMSEILKAKAQNDQAEADRHKVDPKRQRWSAIASAATDAITGLSGMIGVSNGSNAFDVTSSSANANDYYSNERKLRQEALDRYYKNAFAAHKQDYDNLMALRQRKYEDLVRRHEENQRKHNEDLYPYQVRTAASNAKIAESNAEFIPAKNNSEIELAKARAEAARRPKPAPAPKTPRKKTLPGGSASSVLGQ